MGQRPIRCMTFCDRFKFLDDCVDLRATNMITWQLHNHVIRITWPRSDHLIKITPRAGAVVVWAAKTPIWAANEPWSQAGRSPLFQAELSLLAYPLVFFYVEQFSSYTLRVFARAVAYFMRVTNHLEIWMRPLVIPVVHGWLVNWLIGWLVIPLVRGFGWWKRGFAALAQQTAILTDFMSIMCFTSDYSLAFLFYNCTTITKRFHCIQRQTQSRHKKS